MFLEEHKLPLHISLTEGDRYILRFHEVNAFCVKVKPHLSYGKGFLCYVFPTAVVYRMVLPAR